MSKKIALILSGCGVQDGTEIHEAVISLLTLDRCGAQVLPAAPNMAQTHVVHHVNGQLQKERRDVLAESARITRGTITDLAQLRVQDVDGAIFPGGYGAAKNLSDYALKGRGMSVNADVERFIRQMRSTGKPMGFICIAPMLAAKVLGHEHPVLTIGSDVQTAADLEFLGARHQVAAVGEVVVDRDHRLVSTPAYMLAHGISQAAVGIEKLVHAVLELA